MKFRPCIDIHDGKVKQIVGGSIESDGDEGNFETEGAGGNFETADAGGNFETANVGERFETESAGGCGVKENYVSEADASYYAALYRDRGLKGGHIILLNRYGTDAYAADMAQAERALKEYPGGFLLGGGINADNAAEVLRLGASHVIVTSYVFADGRINFDNLKKLKKAVGRERIVLDMSCRMRGDGYYVVTDRWTKFTKEKLTPELMYGLGEYCDEFLVHAVDVEGHKSGIEEGVARILGGCEGITSTYAGGIASMEDIELLKRLGNGKIDFTVGSALDIFGGSLRFDEIAALNKL